MGPRTEGWAQSRGSSTVTRPSTDEWTPESGPCTEECTTARGPRRKGWTPARSTSIKN